MENSFWSKRRVSAVMQIDGRRAENAALRLEEMAPKRSKPDPAVLTRDADARVLYLEAIDLTVSQNQRV